MAVPSGADDGMASPDRTADDREISPARADRLCSGSLAVRHITAVLPEVRWAPKPFWPVAAA